jgi:glycosyltransferase involved in cell wall biosynthesis
LDNKKSKQINSRLVSIIIPCYNQGNYLLDAVNSVKKQAYTNWEIIIVDDGSTDKNTIKLLDKINDQKIKVLHTKNQGLAMARNNGIEGSKGGFLLPLDADDMIDEEYLKKALRIFTTHKEIDILYPKVKIFGDYSSEISFSAKISIPEELISNNLSYCSIFRRRVYQKIKDKRGFGYNPKMEFGYEDWEFWICALEQDFTFSLLDYFLFYYRKHGVSMLEKAHTKHLELYSRIIDEHKEIYRKYVKEINILTQRHIQGLTTELSSVSNEKQKRINDLETQFQKLNLRYQNEINYQRQTLINNKILERIDNLINKALYPFKMLKIDKLVNSFYVKKKPQNKRVKI